MAMNDKEIKHMIRELETDEFRQRFPRELRAYLYDQYGEDPWPYGFSIGDLYGGIRADAQAYFRGTLDVAIKPPLEKAQIEIQDLRNRYGDAMCELRILQKYIDELHELLWSNGLEGRRMLHPESGIHEGAYAEYNTLHPQEFE